MHSVWETLFPFLLRHLAPAQKGNVLHAGGGQGRTAELPARFEGKGLVGLGRVMGTPFEVAWVLPTPAKQPWTSEVQDRATHGGANTEVWGHGLCTNTWKVNSSW